MCLGLELYLIEILHQTTTSCRTSATSDCCILSKFYIKPQQRIRHKIGHSVVSYRNSTSNHNSGTSTPNSALLYLIEILHQTTTDQNGYPVSTSCILSKFYIKPQLARQWLMVPCGCILSKFYIKPQLLLPYGYAIVVVSYRNSTSNHN